MIKPHFALFLFAMVDIFIVIIWKRVWSSNKKNPKHEGPTHFHRGPVGYFFLLLRWKWNILIFQGREEGWFWALYSLPSTTFIKRCIFGTKFLVHSLKISVFPIISRILSIRIHYNKSYRKSLRHPVHETLNPQPI